MSNKIDQIPSFRQNSSKSMYLSFSLRKRLYSASAYSSPVRTLLATSAAMLNSPLSLLIDLIVIRITRSLEHPVYEDRILLDGELNTMFPDPHPIAAIHAREKSVGRLERSWRKIMGSRGHLTSSTVEIAAYWRSGCPRSSPD